MMTMKKPKFVDRYEVRQREMAVHKFYIYDRLHDCAVGVRNYPSRYAAKRSIAFRRMQEEIEVPE